MGDGGWPGTWAGLFQGRDLLIQLADLLGFFGIGARQFAGPLAGAAGRQPGAGGAQQETDQQEADDDGPKRRRLHERQRPEAHLHHFAVLHHEGDHDERHDQEQDPPQESQDGVHDRNSAKNVLRFSLLRSRPRRKASLRRRCARTLGDGSYCSLPAPDADDVFTGSASARPFRRSRNSLPVLKNGTTFCSTATVSPVRGLRPRLASRNFTEKAPKPRSSTRSRCASASVISSKIVVTMRSTSR